MYVAAWFVDTHAFGMNSLHARIVYVCTRSMLRPHGPLYQPVLQLYTSKKCIIECCRNRLRSRYASTYSIRGQAPHLNPCNTSAKDWLTPPVTSGSIYCKCSETNRMGPPQCTLNARLMHAYCTLQCTLHCTLRNPYAKLKIQHKYVKKEECCIYLIRFMSKMSLV